MKIIAAKDNTGDFDTVQAAIDSVKEGESAEIFVKNGFYFEKVVIDKPNITITGESAENTVIVYNDCALRKNDKGEYLGTFATSTVEVTQNAPNTIIQNVTIENSAGYGKIVGQAVALNAGGDRSVFRKCRLIARQDTLMMIPCFIEAQENPDMYIRQYFEDCYIEGDVDFIFGGATAVFRNCDIFCKHRPIGYNCYVTAACTPENIDYGFVFFNCRIDGEAEKGTAYLGRPWLPSARTVFIDTEATDVLSPDVWSKWGKDRQHNAACYAQNSFKTAADWTDILSDEDIKEYTVENIFKDWRPF